MISAQVVHFVEVCGITGRRGLTEGTLEVFADEWLGSLEQLNTTISERIIRKHMETLKYSH